MNKFNDIDQRHKNGLYVIESLQSIHGKGEQLKNELLKLVPLTRKEKGCISYDLFVDQTNLEHFTVVMHWIDQKAYTAHQCTEHIVDFVKKFQDKLYTDDNITEHLYNRLI